MLTAGEGCSPRLAHIFLSSLLKENVLTIERTFVTFFQHICCTMTYLHVVLGVIYTFVRGSDRGNYVVGFLVKI